MRQTRAEWIDEFSATVGYESDPSGELARRFVIACRMLRTLTPTSSTQSQGGMMRFGSEFDVTQLEAMEQQALRFISICDSRSPQSLVAKQQVARQFGFNILRREDPTTNPPAYAEVDN